MMEKIVDLWNVPFGSILLMIFPSQFKFDGNLICSYSNSDKVFIAKFCTCHDSCAVVECAKICCDLSTKNWIIAKWSFHQTCITSKISTVKCAAMPSLFPYCWRSIPGKQRENRKGSNLGPLSMPGFVGDQGWNTRGSRKISHWTLSLLNSLGLVSISHKTFSSLGSHGIGDLK